MWASGRGLGGRRRLCRGSEPQPLRPGGKAFAFPSWPRRLRGGLLALAPAAGSAGSAASPPGLRRCHASQTHRLLRGARALLSGPRCLWGRPWAGEGVPYVHPCVPQWARPRRREGLAFPPGDVGSRRPLCLSRWKGTFPELLSGVGQAMGGLLPPRHFLQPHVTIFFLSEFHFYFPFGRVRFLCSFRSNRPDRAASGRRTCTPS